MKYQCGNKITEHEFTKDIGHRTEGTLDLAKNNSNGLELRKMFDNYSRVYALEEACGECELCVDNEETMQEIISEVTKQIQSDLLKEVLSLGVNTPDEVKEKNKHLDSTSQEQLYSGAIGYWSCLNDIKKLAEDKGIIINK